jgi:hypothetical protein
VVSFRFTLVQQTKDNQMIVRHFIRVPVGSTVYCDNQLVKILEKGYALALCDVNGKRVYITCYDLEKKPFVSMNEKEPTHARP